MHLSVLAVVPLCIIHFLSVRGGTCAGAAYQRLRLRNFSATVASIDTLYCPGVLHMAAASPIIQNSCEQKLIVIIGEECAEETNETRRHEFTSALFKLTIR
jgi:hypothetical protein